MDLTPSAPRGWGHTVFVLLRLAEFTGHNVLQAHPRRGRGQKAVLFRAEQRPQHEETAAQLPVHRRTRRLFPPFFQTWWSGQVLFSSFLKIRSLFTQVRGKRHVKWNEVYIAFTCWAGFVGKRHSHVTEPLTPALEPRGFDPQGAKCDLGADFCRPPTYFVSSSLSSGNRFLWGILWTVVYP